MGVSDGTIRFRMNKMLKSGLLKITASINPFTFRDGILAVIGMQLEKRTHAQTMSNISKIKGVLSVSNVTGTYDLLVEAFFESRRELQHFLVADLSQVGGINKTDTFIVLDSLNKWVELPSP
jgi:Lrp/AsnC family transcriptional regulator for asnA, asnC and gidA